MGQGEIFLIAFLLEFPICMFQSVSQEVLPEALPKFLLLPSLLLKVVSKWLVMGIRGRRWVQAGKGFLGPRKQGKKEPSQQRMGISRTSFCALSSASKLENEAWLGLVTIRYSHGGETDCHSPPENRPAEKKEIALFGGVRSRAGEGRSTIESPRTPLKSEFHTLGKC